MKKKHWFKPKAFTHITTKLSHEDGKWITEYVSNPKNVQSHPFYPLIHRTIITKRFKESVAKDNNPVKRHYTFKQGTRTPNFKPREIYYPNHLDAHIYSYYAQKLLEPVYEQKLNLDFESRINESVLAYRRIPLSDMSRNKSNIDFAFELFTQIKESKGEIAVLALDISKFFDSLDHERLKRAWAYLLGRKDLEKDHYKVFKSLIEFDYVEMSDLLKEFGFKNPKQLIQKDVSYFVKDGKEFRDRIKHKGYLKKNPFRRPEKNGEKKMVGIPQGTPISPFLANLYLYEFDKEVLNYLKQFEGIYRRYSDDIIIICPKNIFGEVEETIYSLIKKVDLDIQKLKTQRSFFINGRLEKRQKPVTYLGFQYDGNNIRLKSGSISKFYRKMKKAVKFRAFQASLRKKKLNKGMKVDATLHRTKLYNQFSYLGAKKKKRTRRNFFTYALYASEVMNNPKIAKQLSQAWRILHEEIKKQEKKFKLPKM